MAPQLQLLAVCLLPLVSLCWPADTGGQGRLSVWALSAAPLGSAARQVSRVKDRSDRLPGGLEQQSGADRSPLRHRTAADTVTRRELRRLSAPTSGGRRRPPVPPHRSGAARRRRARSRPARSAFRRDGSSFIPPSINALIRSSLGRLGTGPRPLPPPGSFVTRLPPRAGPRRPYVVRLPAGHGGGLPGRQGKRVVLIVPVKGGGGSALRRPAVVPLVRDAGHGGRSPTLVSVTGDVKGPEGYPVVPEIGGAAGRRRPSSAQPHPAITPQTVYTLDNPRLRKSDKKGYGPPKLSDIINCTELNPSDCYL